MSVFDNRDYDNHGQVLFCRDQEAGLFAIIAIHDTPYRIFEMAQQKGRPISEVADDLARQKIAPGRASRK